MLESISPYTLLQQSKPKQPKQISTNYDQSYSGEENNQSPVLSNPSLKHVIESEASPVSSPVRRTHYIADIHARHSSAIRHAPQNLPPM